ncbi:MAG: uroporphyrinogen decarboxylase/cobalamine-independent methonine synthase family protein [Candidatus Geothermincolia bacterium]
MGGETRERLASLPDRWRDRGLQPFQTTAMAIMPHADIERAMELALGMDIPFWPQLPALGFSEDSYVQTARGFPGIVVDSENERLTWSEGAWLEELEHYLAQAPASETFDLVPHSVTYGRFLDLDLSERAAIRGQLMGPISFCLKVLDEEKKPIIYRDDVRLLAIQHIATKANRQLEELAALNQRAFVWVDEPGLELLFSGMAGYTADRAREDMEMFLASLNGPRVVHLCGNPDWDFLLRNDIELLSFNAFGCGAFLTGYQRGLSSFIENGSWICWGIAPAAKEDQATVTAAALAERLRDLWNGAASRGIPAEFLASRALISPATCCLVNPDPVAVVERAFELTHEVAGLLRDEFRDLGTA